MSTAQANTVHVKFMPVELRVKFMWISRDIDVIFSWKIHLKNSHEECHMSSVVILFALFRWKSCENICPCKHILEIPVPRSAVFVCVLLLPFYSTTLKSIVRCVSTPFILMLLNLQIKIRPVSVSREQK